MTNNLTVIFALLGSASIKAAHKLLLKSPLDAHLFCSVIKEGLDLILPESFVVLRGRDGPRLLEPLDTP
jgi:hypothetical protein